jgi:hypothetical protein
MATKHQTATFKLEKETKNAVRYQEDSEFPMIGTLYVQKSTFKDHGSIPAEIKVTVEVK